MQLLDATAKNFLSFQEFSYNYSAQGLTNIDGNDDDLDVKTGAGKSSFLDVPCYAFFGKTSKDLKSDEVINWNTKKDLEIHFRFKKEDGIYEVVRYRKHKDFDNDFYILGPNGQQIRGKDARETQKLLEGILGFNYEIFKKSIYFGQFDDTDKFLSSSDKEKKDLISTICDLSAYDEKLDLVKNEIKEDSDNLKDVMQKKDMESSNFNVLSRHLESISLTFNSWGINKEAKLKYLSEKLNETDKEIKEGIENLERKALNWEDDKIKRLSEVDSLILSWNESHSNKLKDLQSKSDNWKDNQDSLIRTMSLDISKLRDDLTSSELEYNNANTTELEDFSAQIEEIELKISDLKLKEREGDKIFAEKQHLEKLNQDLKDVIVAEKRKIEEGLGSDCPHCYQKITGEAIETKILGIYQEGKNRKHQIEKCQLDIDKINEELMVITEYNIQLKVIIEKKRLQQMQSMNVRNLKDRWQGLKSSLDSKINDIDREKNRENPVSLSILSVKNEVNPHNSSRYFINKEVNSFISELNSFKEKINPYPKMIEDAKDEVNPHIDQLEKTKQDIKDISSSLDKYNLEIERIEHQIQLGEFWKAGLGTYIKSMLMDSFLEQLNIQANEYLITLFDGVLKIDLASVTEGKKGVKEKISQKIFNGNHECSYNALSGGERSRICLAINLALSDITCKSLGTSFSLLMLDEVFNGLDNSGKVQTMKLLKELEPRFETILVIDHTEEFKSLFTNVITVRKKGGISQIV